MDRKRLLRSACLIALAIGATVGGVDAAFADAPRDPDTTAVEGTHTDHGVDLNATQRGVGDQPPTEPDAAPPPPPPDPGTARCFQTADAICVADRAAPAPLPGEPGAPTLTDIATFPVTVATARNQPTGWGVVDRPTNFYADGGAHVVSGTLLGQPALVRFTPVAWQWDYGDGTTATLDRPGAAWDTSAQFRLTPTSHVYTRKNDFTVTLHVVYVAEYQYAGQPWRDVAGALRVRANDLQIITWRVKTVLVAEDCIANPSGAGCPGTLRRDDLEY